MLASVKANSLVSIDHLLISLMHQLRDVKMKPTIRQLQIFCTIVDQLSFRRSSELLNTSQPGLTRSIKELEQSIGTELLFRTTRTIRPTPAGRELYKRGKLILQDLGDAVNATRDVASGRAGSLTISYIDFALIGPMPRILSSFRSAHPNVELIVRYMVTNDQIPDLIRGKVDIGFVFGEPKIEGLTTRRLVSEGLVAIVPDGHRLKGRGKIRLAELAEETFVLGDARWARFNQIFLSCCHESGFSPSVSQTAYTRDELISFVLAGNGIAIYPECIVNTPRTGIEYLTIEDIHRSIITSAIWRGESENGLVRRFIEFL
ncbi:MAG: LysR family transcriptional regulator [Rhizobiaceae bacterium]|nr:LysR family transcriptional regulator [Rhizobiaceae bacterium]